MSIVSTVYYYILLLIALDTKYLTHGTPIFYSPYIEAVKMIFVAKTAIVYQTTVVV